MELKMLRERHSGGMMMSGETAILKGGEMLVSAQSPTQVFAERRAESLAVQAMTGGGGGEGGGGGDSGGEAGGTRRVAVALAAKLERQEPLETRPRTAALARAHRYMA